MAKSEYPRRANTFYTINAIFPVPDDKVGYKIESIGGYGNEDHKTMKYEEFLHLQRLADSYASNRKNLPEGAIALEIEEHTFSKRENDYVEESFSTYSDLPREVLEGHSFYVNGNLYEFSK